MNIVITVTQSCDRNCLHSHWQRLYVSNKGHSHVMEMSLHNHDYRLHTMNRLHYHVIEISYKDIGRGVTSGMYNKAQTSDEQFRYDHA